MIILFLLSKETKWTLHQFQFRYNNDRATLLGTINLINHIGLSFKNDKVN